MCFAGEKEEDQDSSTWWDWPDYMGSHQDFVDDADYEDGFLWSCCDKSGGRRGCIASRHKIARRASLPAPVRLPTPPRAEARREVQQLEQSLRDDRAAKRRKVESVN